MEINQYLDSTYLKTAEQAGLSDGDNLEVVRELIEDAIQYKMKAIMVRPNVVAFAKSLLGESENNVIIGTVIDFPNGTASTDLKIVEAESVIADGADELDFVLDYKAFINGDIEIVRDQIIRCTKLALDNFKIIKWIIEVAALDDTQIVQLTVLIKNTIMKNFGESQFPNIFVKSSTGFYKTEDGLPNGATPHTIQLMLENSFPLPVKAAGGVRNFEEAQQMIQLGVTRIGTSSARQIIEGQNATGSY